MPHRFRHVRRILLSCGALLLNPAVAPAFAAGTTPAATPAATTAATTAATVPAGATSDTIAKRGDHSSKVVQVQQQLIAAGITVRGGADGVFGAGTEAAVKDYQRKRGLTVNGVVDVPTATALGVVPPTPLLAKGASGAAVMQVQQQLIAAGITVRGGADGSYGSGTKAAVLAFQTSKGLPASGDVDAATAAILANAAGTPAADTTTPAPPAVRGQLAAFPVTKTCKFWDTWGAPRSGGRKHQGVDIAAASGTSVIAVQKGTITKRQLDSRGSLAGNALWLTAADGTYYFYAHLSSFADGVGVGSPVRAGDLIGYVGKTGNAGVPHLHFEIHLNGGAAVNPYPIVKAASDC